MTSPATILLVEDDKALLEGIADLLEISDLGYEVEVLTASNGRMGLQVLASRTPDLIISDIMMPRMGGYEFLQKVRQSPELVHIPFIFLTARGTKHDVLRGRMSGAELYIKKPYDSDELCQLIKSQLDRSFELRGGRERQVSLVSRNIVQLLHHEFRTPLTYVTAYQSLLAEGIGQEDEGELREYLDGIHAGARRMSALVRNLLQVLAIWTGEAAEHYEREAAEISDLDKKLAALCQQYAADVERMNGRFVCDIEHPLPTLYGVEAYILEIVRQLLANAVTFSGRVAGRRPEVRLAASASDRQLRITVEDNGLGIPQQAYEQIFELFYQHDRQRLEQQGAGAGLTIARGLAELHRGRISVISDAIVGTVFTVTLPLNPAMEVAVNHQFQTEIIPATVLLVEDELFLLEGLRDLLDTFESRYDLTIMTAANGRRALELMAGQTPDLIVTDIMMPEMNGYQFMTEVRANPDWVEIPVVFLTAKGERQDVLLGLSSGAEEYITKPYDVEELFGVVSTQLDKRFLRQGAAKQNLEQLKVNVLELLLAEFTVPLADVTEYSDLLGESLAGVQSLEQLRLYLLGLEQGSNHITRLVEDFILLVELRTGETVDWFKLQAKPRSINQAMRQAGPKLQTAFDWLEVEIRYNLDAEEDSALIDERLLGKCFERLTEEILNHCPQESPVRLTLTSELGGEQVRLLVGSRDAEFSEEKIEWLAGILESPKVFEPELRDFSLALLLVKGIIHFHNGTLTVTSAPGSGLTFMISLPAYRDQ
ncbi:MAG: response regulator [Chloroflexota bacterium]|jgi:DNA-binding response OmpR family regulator